MESRVKSQISRNNRRKQSGKMKVKNRRNANNGKAYKEDGNNLSTNALSELITEFDEAERLCLPNINMDSFVQRNNNMDPKYPKHYNANEYENLGTAVERQKYRNRKDLRNNPGNTTGTLPEPSDHRICFTQLRGQKCGDGTCLFRHDFRLPRKLRLCSGWKNGTCADGQFCLYLHSEFPCRVHYLGLKNVRHDLNTCRYYHGGSLPKEYEEMFLESIDLERHPMSLEMYKNQAIRLKGIACDLPIQPKKEFIDPTSTEKQEVEKCSITPPVESAIDVIAVAVPVSNHDVNDSEVCQENDQECE